MKTIALLFLTAFIGKGCSSASTDLKDTVVTYTANTRGFYMKIVIQDQKISISRDRNDKEMPASEKIDDKVWGNLVAAFQKIELEKLPEYKGKTEKRFYDGAAMANLHIVFKDKTYDSQTFDHGSPPAEIEKFVNLIVGLSTIE